MKPKKLNKKLVLNKKTMAHLNTNDQGRVQAGIDYDTDFCTPPGICPNTKTCNNCTVTCPPCTITYYPT